MSEVPPARRINYRHQVWRRLIPIDDDEDKTKGETRSGETALDDDAETLVKSPKMTLELYLKEWLGQKKIDGVREITQQGYKDTVDIYILRHPVGTKRLSQITPRDVQDLYNHLQFRGLSTVAIKGVRTLLRMAFRQAIVWRYIQTNPAADIPAHIEAQGTM